ncbi:hypothetical protein DXG01_015558 [Tephrocybe rancida]|nr:hypothetical protein DXG01_015558 [Tephrocybe rancida]
MTVAPERPDSASSAASSVVSELGPASSGAHCRHAILQWFNPSQELREARFKILVTGHFPCFRCWAQVASDTCSLATLKELRQEYFYIVCALDVPPYIVEDVFDLFNAADHALRGTVVTSKSAARRHERQGVVQQFFSLVKRTAKAVHFWILPEDKNTVDRCVGPMLSTSFLPGVLLFYLVKAIQTQSNLGRQESFEAIMSLSKALATRKDPCLNKVVVSPTIVDESKGLRAWLWDDDQSCLWSGRPSDGSSFAQLALSPGLLSLLPS